MESQKTTNNNCLFIELSQAIRNSSDLFDARISLIENNILNHENAEADSCVKVFLIRSLKKFRDTVLFISVATKDFKDADFVHVLSSVRTLLDIYCRILFLLESSGYNQMALICTAYQLTSLRDINDEKLHNDGLRFIKSVINEEKYIFPEYNKWDYIWYSRKSNLNFKTTRDMFIPEIIQKHSPLPKRLFTGENFCQIYGHISEICHGNPYYYNENESNEKYWSVSMTIMAISYVISAIDNGFAYKIKSSPRDFRDWIDKIDIMSKQLTHAWKSNNLEKKQ